MIIPAVDIINGQCVRLTQGDYTQKTTYYDDPLEAARQFELSGCRYLHLVDLDGAKMSCPQNTDVLRCIASNTSLEVEYGGGIKSRDAVEQVLSAGAKRVIIGSMAITNIPLFNNLIDEFGLERIVLGADCRDGRIATHGWLTQSEITIPQLLVNLHPVRHIIVTDIARDGTMMGPNIELYRQLHQQYPDLDIIASGGVSCPQDLEQLYNIGIQHIIVGKALYEGKIKL